jgi:alditol oxidase
VQKRTFLKLSSAMLTAPALAPLSRLLPSEKLTNWAGNYTYSTDRLHTASLASEVAAVVKQHDRLKVLGTRHCFNGIADSSHNLLTLPGLDKVLALNTTAKTVTVGASMKYGQLAPYLHEKGFALHNLASLPHISVAGACATATHGSGMENGNLATAVSALEFITATGEVRSLSRASDGDTFRGAVVHLGALGVITKVTLDLQPTFEAAQYVYENLPMAQLKDHFDEIMGSGYSVSLFTDWQRQTISEVWVKRRAEPGMTIGMPGTLFGATAAQRDLHPIVALDAANCTPQMGVPGPWYERVPHFRMGFTPSSGKELQAEYFVPHSQAVEAMLAVERLRNRIAPHLFISEIRTIAADDLWMSTAYKRPSVAIHFTWRPHDAAVRQLLPVIERELAPFGARPHWGKLFATTPAQLAKLYERLPDFQQLARQLDPKRKFVNTYLTNSVLGT